MRGSKERKIDIIQSFGFKFFTLKKLLKNGIVTSIVWMIMPIKIEYISFIFENNPIFKIVLSSDLILNDKNSCENDKTIKALVWP